MLNPLITGEEIILRLKLEEDKNAYHRAIDSSFKSFFLKGGYDNKEAYEHLKGILRDEIKEDKASHKYWKNWKATGEIAKKNKVYKLRYYAYMIQWTEQYLAMIELYAKPQ